MTPEDVAYLQSAAAQMHLSALQDTPITKHNHLQIASLLRRTISAEHAHLLIETTLLRQKAAVKFTHADRMVFDRAGLEMSSAEPISHHRAQRYAPFDHVTDLCCGLGGDAIGLVTVANVRGVDWDAGRIAMADVNVNVNANITENGRGNFEGVVRDVRDAVSDAMSMGTASETAALFFDPARRDERGKRIYSLANYRPPLSILEAWRPITSHWGVKISPGVDYVEIPAEAEVEFISFNGELREAVLWFGGLRGAAERTATLLPSGASLDSNAVCGDVAVSEPLGWLYEPDAAVLRAHLVQHLATRLGAHQLDETIAYLTHPDRIDTLFARRFEVEAWFPFQLKRLRRYLRERDVGRVTIKKRGSPIDTDQLHHQLKLKGTTERTLHLTRHAGNPIVVITL